MKRAWIIASLFVSFSSAQADDGRFGLGNAGPTADLTVPCATGIAPPCAPVNLPGILYRTMTAKISGAELELNDVTGFSIGDLVMVWQPGGLTPTTTGTPNVGVAGPLNLANDVGRRELARITAVDVGLNQITVTASEIGSVPLFGGYLDGQTQVIRVPEYNDVTIALGATVTAPAFDPVTSQGGIVAFLANGTVTVTGAINVDGKGFPGGVVFFGNSTLSGAACTDDNLAKPNGQVRGFGVAGNAFPLTPTPNDSGRGNVANGGGGGNCSRTGGGGGGNADNGGKGGNGPILGGPNDNPGKGGADLDYSLMNRLVMGGGGGAGNQTNLSATSGLAGGGVIFFRAAAVAGTGTITANGQVAPAPSADDGQGGGGAGGSIIIRTPAAVAQCLVAGSIAAHGGDGIAAPVPTPAPGPVGAGGGGGGGKTFVQTTSTCNANPDVSGGAGGFAVNTNSDGDPGDDGDDDDTSNDGFCSSGQTVITAPDHCQGGLLCFVTATTDSTDTNNNRCFDCDTTRFGADPDPATQQAQWDTACATQYPTVPAVGQLARPHCDSAGTNQHMCVECTQSSHCPNTNPVCNASDVCEGCGADGDCTARSPAVKCLNPGAGTGQCVQCINNADCNGTPSTPSCDTGTHLCVPCDQVSADTGCGGSTPHCKRTGEQGSVMVGTCVECTGTTQTLSNGQCTSGASPACLSDNTCGGCTSLSGDNGCLGHGPTHDKCNGDDTCVDCLVNTDCGSSAPACNTDHTCQLCTVLSLNTGCVGRDPTTVCKSNGLCVQCVANTDCDDDPALPGCKANNTCAVCNDPEFTNVSPNAGCTGHSPSLCETTNTNSRIGQCVACRSSNNSADCNTDASPLCTAANTCGMCTSDPGPCGNGNHINKTHCETFNNVGACVECRSDTTPLSAQCTDPTKPQCVSNSCTTCSGGAGELACNQNFLALGFVQPAHCESIGPQAGHCANCRLVPTPSPFPSPAPVQTNDCPLSDDPLCVNNANTSNINQCGGCTTNTQCAPRFGASFVCDVSSGDCVGCTQNSDCLSSSQPRCNLANKSCLGCLSDSDCSEFVASGLPACQPPTTQNVGACKQCSITNVSLCVGATPACNFFAGTCQLCTVDAAGFDGGTANSTGCVGNVNGNSCQGVNAAVFCGCNTDANCGNETGNRVTSGRICNINNNLCVNGCSRAPGRNNCPTNQFCTSNDVTGATTGVCTIDCNFDVDCQTSMPTMPFCIAPDGDAGRGRCAGCRNDGDCSTMLPVCQATNRVCVECTATRLEACSSAGKGAICLSDETCGCSADTDCGGATSGRVCDLSATHKCIAGCRQTGGNGCPSGLVCTSTSMTPGMCVTPMDMAMGPDLGVPDAGSADMPVPIDMGPTLSLSGGGIGCSFGGAASTLPSLSGMLLLLGLAGLVRRRRK